MLIRLPFVEKRKSSASALGDASQFRPASGLPLAYFSLLHPITKQFREGGGITNAHGKKLTK